MTKNETILKCYKELLKMTFSSRTETIPRWEALQPDPHRAVPQKLAATLLFLPPCQPPEPPNSSFKATSNPTFHGNLQISRFPVPSTDISEEHWAWRWDQGPAPLGSPIKPCGLRACTGPGLWVLDCWHLQVEWGTTSCHVDSICLNPGARP